MLHSGLLENFMMLISRVVPLEILRYFILTLWFWCSFLRNGKIALFRLKNSRNCDHAKESYTQVTAKKKKKFVSPYKLGHLEGADILYTKYHKLSGIFRGWGFKPNTYPCWGWGWCNGYFLEQHIKINSN